MAYDVGEAAQLTSNAISLSAVSFLTFDTPTPLEYGWERDAGADGFD
jgi:hypothetical protein